MVALSRRNAETAGVADKAKFVQGDMFDADFSQATVLALFLLPGNLDKLAPKFLRLPAGTAPSKSRFTYRPSSSIRPGEPGRGTGSSP